jgi:hypothetical protein
VTALEESGNDAFPYLFNATEPATVQQKAPAGGFGCGCGSRSKEAGLAAPPPVKVLDEKLVAGFNAVVLEARSADALVGWLKEHDYANSPEIQAWAQPYVEAGWKFTALKVAKQILPAGTDVEPIDDALAGMERIRQIARDLGAFAHKNSDHLRESILVSDVVGLARRLCSQDLASLDVVITIPEGLRVRGSQTQLSQVVVNLLLNGSVL